jgi:hypothetical protein
MFRLTKKSTAKIERLTKNQNKQSVYAVIWNESWYFKVISENNQSVWIEFFWTKFHFTVEGVSLIQKGDKLTINWTEYFVSAIWYKEWIKVKYTRAVLDIKQ